MRRSSLIAAALLVASAAGAVATSIKLDSLRPQATLEEVLYLPSPRVLKRLSLGYHGLLADIYWTRAVQYFGGKHVARASSFNLLYPLLDITTQLDPHLIIAYQFGSVFLAQKPPEGAGDPDKAVALVERGIRENPEQWRLYYHLGFIHYLERKDYNAAAQAFEDGSKVPGAYPWMKVMAAVMRQNAGDLGTARFLWKTVYDGTDDKMLRDNAAKHLVALQVDEDVALLEKVLAAYHDRTGRWPQDFAELVSAGVLRGIPRDPIGNPYKVVYGSRVEVADPDKLPFIREGLPPGKEPTVTLPNESNKQVDQNKDKTKAKTK